MRNPVDEALAKYHKERAVAELSVFSRLVVLAVLFILSLFIIKGTASSIADYNLIRDKAQAYDDIQEDLAAFTAVARED